MSGWVGVDLDATLAVYEPGDGIDSIGVPIADMMRRVKAWVDDGQEVKIMTARVSALDRDYEDEPQKQRNMIQDWLAEHGLPRLEVVCEKDYMMLELWDDRAVAVERNTGVQLSASRLT